MTINPFNQSAPLKDSSFQLLLNEAVESKRSGFTFSDRSVQILPCVGVILGPPSLAFSLHPLFWVGYAKDFVPIILDFEYRFLSLPLTTFCGGTTIVCFSTMGSDSYFGIDWPKMMLVGPHIFPNLATACLCLLTNCLSLSENVAGSLRVNLLNKVKEFRYHASPCSPYFDHHHHGVLLNNFRYASFLRCSQAT